MSAARDIRIILESRCPALTKVELGQLVKDILCAMAKCDDPVVRCDSPYKIAEMPATKPAKFWESHRD